MSNPKLGEFAYPPLPRLTSPFADNIPWYVGADAQNRPSGFTSQPDQAMKDYHGIPVLCPGDVNRVWNKEFERQRQKKAKVWNYLLDRMEEELDLADQQEEAAKAGDVMRQRQIKRDRVTNRGVQHGLKLALVEMELPPGRSTNIEDDMNWIEKRAQALYDREAG